MVIVKGKRTREETRVTWKSPSCTAILNSGGVSEGGANGGVRHKGGYQINNNNVFKGFIQVSL